MRLQGSLSFEELWPLAQGVTFAGGRKITPDDLRSVMAHVDSSLGGGDEDGVVSLEELLAGLDEAKENSPASAPSGGRRARARRPRRKKKQEEEA